VITVSIDPNRALKGHVRIFFFTDDPDSSRHEARGNKRCSCLLTWWEKKFSSLTDWLTRQGDVCFGHVELMFSNEVVTSVSVAGGVHFTADKYLSNPDYRNVRMVKMSIAAESAMYNEAKGCVGKPFNVGGRAWNSIPFLRRLTIVDGRKESFYCSEYVTHLLKIAAAVDKSSLCADLDPRITNPTELYLYLKDSGTGLLDYNEKLQLAEESGERVPLIARPDSSSSPPPPPPPPSRQPPTGGSNGNRVLNLLSGLRFGGRGGGGGGGSGVHSSIKII